MATMKPECPQVPHPHILGMLPGMVSQPLPWQPVPGLNNLPWRNSNNSMKEFSLESDPNLFWFNLRLFPQLGILGARGTRQWQLRDVQRDEHRDCHYSHPKGINTGIVTAPIPKGSTLELSLPSHLWAFLQFFDIPSAHRKFGESNWDIPDFLRPSFSSASGSFQEEMAFPCV